MQELLLKSIPDSKSSVDNEDAKSQIDKDDMCLMKKENLKNETFIDRFRNLFT